MSKKCAVRFTSSKDRLGNRCTPLSLHIAFIAATQTLVFPRSDFPVASFLTFCPFNEQRWQNRETALSDIDTLRHRHIIST